jgi:L-lactate dehydrogenase complex protein LldG
MSANTTSQAREQILGKIRKALSADQLPMPFPEVDRWDAQAAFVPNEINLEELFAAQFIGLGGKYIFCADELELLTQINALYESRSWTKLFAASPALLQICAESQMGFVLPADNTDETADACITDCEALIARTGSFLMSSRQMLGRVSSVFYPVHIVVAYKKDIVYDIEDGLSFIQEKYPQQLPSMISLQTGPSRTADIEKTLVTGVHGPKEVFCFFVNQ